jgi:MoaA/NifB/PqqE/SkfB family radical SAM enzyme
MTRTAFRRKLHAWRLKGRVARLVVKGLRSTEHPVLVHMIPTRRCNLTCTYCNEYDRVSPPVPVDALLERVDRLAELGTSIVTMSGGEPLLHPDIDRVIGRVRSHGMIAGLITNGYLLTAERIRRLNAARLDHMQISIDNVVPDDTSKKSLKVLDRKLELLAENAEFQVNVNSVLGACVHHPGDAATVARRAVQLGFISTVGILHDGSGQLEPLDPEQRRIYEDVKRLGTSSFGRINRYNPFQRNLVEGKPNNWWYCRAGARYLYICEDGLVHYCSQQRGYPGIPLAPYTRDDIRREYRTRKGCAPYCTIGCVHQVSILDRWRHPQTIEYQPDRDELVTIREST